MLLHRAICHLLTVFRFLMSYRVRGDKICDHTHVTRKHWQKNTQKKNVHRKSETSERKSEKKNINKERIENGLPQCIENERRRWNDKAIARFNFISIFASTLMRMSGKYRKNNGHYQKPQFLKIQLFFFLKFHLVFCFIILFGFPGWKMMSKHNSPAALSLSRSIFIVVVIRARNLFGCVVFMHNGRDEPCRPERLLALVHFFSFRSCEKTSGSKKRNVCSVTIRKRLSEHWISR